MGTIFVDKLDPQSGTSLEIGSSGDTISVPSGATINLSNATQTGVGGVNTPIFRAYKSGNQSISSSTAVKVTWGGETFDTDNAFASDKFTVPSGKGGKYVIYAQVRKSTTSENLNLIYIYVNGSSKGYVRRTTKSENSNQITNIVDLSAGDYVEIYVYDDGGSAGILSNADNYSYFTGYRLIE